MLHLFELCTDLQPYIWSFLNEADIILCKEVCTIFYSYSLQLPHNPYKIGNILLENACKNAHIDLFDYLKNRYKVPNEIYSLAIKYGQFDMLKWLHNNRYHLNWLDDDLGVEKNNAKQMRYKQEMEIIDLLRTQPITSFRKRLDEILNGLISKLLRYRYLNIEDIENLDGRYEYLNKKIAKTSELNQINLTISDTCQATSLNRTDILEWLIKQGCRVNVEVTLSAITHGNIEVIKWLHDKYPDHYLNEDEIFEEAIGQSGSMVVLEFISKNIVINLSEVLKSALSYGKNDMIKPLIRAMKVANIHIDDSIYSYAIMNGQIETVKLLLNIIPFISKRCIIDSLPHSVRHESTWLFDLLYDKLREFVSNSSFCTANSLLNEELNENPLKLSLKTGNSIIAMIKEDNEFTRYILSKLEKMNIPWSKQSCIKMANDKNFMMIKWLILRNCMWDVEVFYRSLHNFEMAKWLYDQLMLKHHILMGNDEPFKINLIPDSYLTRTVPLETLEWLRLNKLLSFSSMLLNYNLLCFDIRIFKWYFLNYICHYKHNLSKLIFLVMKRGFYEGYMYLIEQNCVFTYKYYKKYVSNLTSTNDFRIFDKVANDPKSHHFLILNDSLTIYLRLLKKFYHYGYPIEVNISSKVHTNTVANWIKKHNILIIDCYDNEKTMEEID